MMKINKKIKSKKAELTTSQIVFWVILITSFLIILYFLVKLNLGGETEAEVCHNSVIMRGNLYASEIIPLNCKTKYLCLSKDGTCEKMTNPEVKRVKTKEAAYKILADSMADCWWMFGEGKIDYVKDEATKNNYCSICSQIAFDDSLTGIGGFEDGVISKDELYQYLSTHQRASKEMNYSEYFFRTSSLDELKQMVSEQTEGAAGTFGKIDINKQYYVMMGITSEVSTIKWMIYAGAYGAVVATGVVLAIFAAPVTIPALIASGVSQVVVIGGTAIGTASGVGISKISDFIEPEISAIVVEGDGIDNKFMAPTIVEAGEEKFKALECEDIKTLT